VKDPTVRLVLDTSAVLAYAVGSINVGETINEVVEEGGRFGASVVCLAEASRLVSEDHRLGVPLLIGHPRCVVLPVIAEDWSALALWTSALGRTDLAASLIEAVDRGGYVLTAEPFQYRPGGGAADLPIVGV
jgi:hypothetical protein